MYDVRLEGLGQQVEGDLRLEGLEQEIKGTFDLRRLITKVETVKYSQRKLNLRCSSPQ